MAQTAALNIKLNVEGLNDIQLSVSNINELKAAIKTLQNTRANLEIGSDGYKEASKQIDVLNAALRQVTRTAQTSGDALKQAQDALNEPPKAIGYYRQLQNQLTVLKNQFKDLSEIDVSGDIGQKLSKEVSQVSAKLKALDAGLGDYQRNVGNYQGAFEGLGATYTKVAGFVGTAIAAVGGASKIIETTREFEKLGALLNQNFKGDNFGAAKAFESIKQLASETPQSVKELTEGFLILSRDGIKPTADELRKLTDLAVSQGKEITQLAEAVQDAKGGEFARLQEFGVKAKKSGDDLVFTFREQKTVVKNTSTEIDKYLVSLGNLSGIQGSSAAIAKTFDGAISNLGDNVDRLVSSLGSAGGLLAGVTSGFSSFLGAVVDFIETPLSEKLKQEQSEFKALTTIIGDNSLSIETRNVAQSTLIRKYPEYIGYIDQEKKSQFDLSKTIEIGNKLFAQRIFLQGEQEKQANILKRVGVFADKYVSTLSEQKQLQDNISKGQLGFFDKLLGASESQIKSNEILLSTLKNGGDVARKELDEFTKGEKERAIAFFGSEESANQAALAFDKFNSSSSVDAAAKAAKEAADAAAKAAKEAAGAVGSIGALSKIVSELRERLAKAAPSATEAITGDLVEAERKLAAAEKALKDARKLFDADVSEFAPKIDETLPPIDISVDVIPKLKDPKKSADEIKKETEAELNKSLRAVEFPVSITGGKTDEERKQEEEDAQRSFDNEYELAKLRLKNEEDLKKVKDEEAAKGNERRQQVKDTAIAAAEELSQAVFSVEQNRISNELNSTKNAINTEYEAKIAAAQGNAIEQDRLRKEQEEKIKAAEKAAFERRKKLAIKEAAIEFALSLIKAGGDPFKSALAAAAFAAALISIQSQQFQEFAEGGVVGKKKKLKRLGSGIVRQTPNHPATAGGDNVAVLLKNKEMVLNEAQQERARKMFGRSIFADIGVPNASGASTPQRFATGGVVTQQSGATVTQVITVESEISQDSINQISSTIAAQTAASVSVAVKDGVISGSIEAENTRIFKERLG